EEVKNQLSDLVEIAVHTAKSKQGLVRSGAVKLLAACASISKEVLGSALGPLRILQMQQALKSIEKDQNEAEIVVVAARVLDSLSRIHA
ncbi:hypothetical protein HDU76_002443, partial [Blyttiomyces sp. JEL0837]